MIFTPRSRSLRSRLTPHENARYARVPAGTPKGFRGGPE
jgi:hypothetical protein